MNNLHSTNKTFDPLITKLFFLAVLLFALPLIAVFASAQAQPAPPSGGPASPQGQFYTLQHIYDRLNTGATDNKPTTFSGPTAGAISSDFPSINDIMAIAPAVDNTNCASPSDVLEDRTYFSLCSSDWGAQTGTAPTPPPIAPEDRQLLATGQNTCYNASGTVITCAGTGQDGEYQLGATADPRFTDNSDGTITDNLTGLIWLQNGNCFGTRSWQNALNDANSLASGSCGLTDGSVAGDWRVPNITELRSLIDYQASSAPRIPSGHPFSSVQSNVYWSSTSYRPVLSNAWYVFLVNGSISGAGKTASYYVWPVR